MVAEPAVNNDHGTKSFGHRELDYANKDLVAAFNGRLGTLAQRLAQVETITDATLTSNVKDLVDRVRWTKRKQQQSHTELIR